MSRKLFRLLVVAALPFTLFSCMVSLQTRDALRNADVEFTRGNYSEALSSYEELLSVYKEKGKTPRAFVLNKAGIAAFKLKKTDKAIKYLEKAKKGGAIDAMGYYSLALSYRTVDNLSREITNLEFCIEKFPSDTVTTDARNQLFSAYVRSENWDKAEKLWEETGTGYRETAGARTQLLKVKKELNRSDEAYALAKALIKEDKNNVDALEVLAGYFYKRADKRYLAEMKAYKKNRTMKQYRRLTKALKTINKDFKVARDYYKKLYRLQPKSSYAKLLGNIYTRFGNKKKASYWYRLARKK